MKKWCSVVFIGVLLFGGIATFPTAAEEADEQGNNPVESAEQAVMFPDIKGHWAEENILAMAERGVVNGFPDGTFRPEEGVTIEQFAKMMLTSLWEKGPDGKLRWNDEYIGRLSDLAVYYLINSGFDPNDIPTTEHWADPYIEQLENMHLIRRDAGVLEGKLDRPLTREAATYMFRHHLHQTEFEENRNYAELALQSITDRHDVNPQIKYDVGLAIIKGMMRGYPDGTFRPKAYITRAEATIIVDRMLNREARDPYKPDLSHSYWASFETGRGTAYVVFESKEFQDIWNATMKLSEKSEGFAYQNGLTFQFYRDKEVRDAFDLEVKQTLMSAFVPDPFELSLGIGASWLNYYVAKEVVTPNTLHDEVFEGYVKLLFPTKSAEFLEFFNQFATDYQETGVVMPRDTIIENRSIRVMQEGHHGRILAFISEQR